VVTKTEIRSSFLPSGVEIPDSPIFREEPPLFEVYSFAKDAIVGEEALRESITAEESSFSYEIIVDKERILVDFKSNGEEIVAETSFYYGTSPNGTTGRLFSSVKDLMTEVASLRGKPVNYRFSTDDPELKMWVIAPYGGKRVFDWDEMTLYRGRLAATKKNNPISTNGHHKQ